MLNVENEFKDRLYINSINYESEHTKEDALILLLKDISYNDLDLFCNYCTKYLKKNYNYDLSSSEIYNLIQKSDLSVELKNIIYDMAFEYLEHGKPFGSHTINDGKINTSSWLNHALLNGKNCGILADLIGLNSDVAIKIGILHDYGRKYDHSINHITKGFEMLQKLGWISESYACLTHSFANGKRCAYNDPATEGFYVDENGKEHYSNPDDLNIFLDNYYFSDYDKILSISDLMATSEGIVSPKERIEDIRTRKPFDPKNGYYFINELCNQLSYYMSFITGEEYEPRIYREEDNDKIMQNFEEINTKFYELYKSKVSNLDAHKL